MPNWEDAWSAGRTKWDEGVAAPALLRLIEEGLLPTGRTLVPGCGAGYDVFALAADPDRHVVGLDLAPTAGRRFEELMSRKRSLRSEAGSNVELSIGDFFRFTPEQPFDLIYDYTFLCALPPERHTEWAEKVSVLLASGGTLVTLIFPVDPIPMNPGGPPYPMTPELVSGLLDPFFTCLQLDAVEGSHPGREGKEWLGRWLLRDKSAASPQP